MGLCPEIIVAAMRLERHAPRPPKKDATLYTELLAKAQRLTRVKQLQEKLSFLLEVRTKHAKTDTLATRVTH